MPKLETALNTPRTFATAILCAIGLVLGSSAVATAQAASSQRSACAVAFSDSPTAGSATGELESLLTYRESNRAARFENAVQLLPVQQKSVLKRILRGIYFVDYIHSATDFLKIFKGEVALDQTRFFDRYNDVGNSAFEKYVDGIRSLRQLKTPLTLEKISELHRATMNNYEDNLGPISPGVYRQRFVYGPEFEAGLSREQINIINSNPYLFYMRGTGIWGDTPSGVEEAQLKGRIRGAIAYPRDRDIKDSTLERIKTTSPDVYARVLAYKAKNGLNYWNLDPQLTQDLTSALLNERLVTLNRDIAKLSDLRNPQDVDAYINLVSRFQRDFISIHPFNDGNGRTSRLLLDYLCANAGLPIPRLISPNEDVYSTPEQWAIRVREGMLATVRLQNDLLRRLERRENFGESLDLLTPLAILGEGANADRKQKFINYLKLQFENAALSEEFTKRPSEVLQRLKSEFEMVTE